MNARSSRRSHSPGRAVRTVLIAVTGKASPILTEALWYLAQTNELPDELVVVTTEAGREEIVESLFKVQDAKGQFPGSCVWDALLAEVEAITGGPPPNGLVRWGPDNSRSLVVAKAPDVQTERRAHTFADELFEEIVRWKNQSPPWRVIGLMGGARKQMESLLYGCMTLLGTEGDRLVIVTVSPENRWANVDPRFYFKPAKPTIHEIIDNPRKDLVAETGLSSATAKIALLDVPFPIDLNPPKKLGDRIAQARERFVRWFAGYNPEVVTVQEIRLDVKRAQLTIKVSARPSVPEPVINLTPMELSVYCFLVAHSKARGPNGRTQQKDLIGRMAIWLKYLPDSTPWGKVMPAENWISRTLITRREKLNCSNLKGIADQILPARAEGWFIPNHEIVQGIPPEFIEAAREHQS